MEHPRVININDLNKIKDKIENKEDFIIYIGHSLCGDCHAFRGGPFKIILEKEKDLKFYVVDFYQRKKINGDWDKIIGPKNDALESQNIPSPTIENFTFYFTPALVFIKDGKAQFNWQDFGGGEKRNSRYFRENEDRQVEGNKNAVKDVMELISKWKQG